MLFGAGDLWYRPRYKGYAFGDSKLTSYRAPKISLFFSRGLRQRDDGNKLHSLSATASQYDEGKIYMGPKGDKPFYTNIPADGAGDKMIFCGVVTPIAISAVWSVHPDPKRTRLEVSI